MGCAEWAEQMPPARLLEQCINIRQVGTIGHGRKAVTKDSVEFGLSLVLSLRKKHKRFDSSVQRERRGISTGYSIIRSAMGKQGAKFYQKRTNKLHGSRPCGELLVVNVQTTILESRTEGLSDRWFAFMCL